MIGMPRGPGAVVGDVPASETKEYTFEVDEGARLEFAEVLGSISVYTGPQGPIKVAVTKHSFGTDKGSALREVKSFDVEPRQKGSTISFRLGSGARPRRQVDYKITAPPDVSVKVGSGRGSVTIGGVKGAVEITGDNVGVMLWDIRGPIAIRTKAGNVAIRDSIGQTLIRSETATIQIDRLTAEALEIGSAANTVIRDSGSASSATFQIKSGDLSLTRFRANSLSAEAAKGRINIEESTAREADLKTEAGKINLYRVAAAKLHATTTTGQMEMDQTEGELDLRTESGTIILSEVRATGLRVAAGAGNVTFYGKLPVDGEHRIKTTAGNIYVYVVKESAFRLDAATRGAITVEPPFVLEQAERKAGHWRGVINRGTALLGLSSGSGEIVISADQPF